MKLKSDIKQDCKCYRSAILITDIVPKGFLSNIQFKS